MTLPALIGNEIRLQLRYGLYTVYGVICITYILILRALSLPVREIVLPVLVFMDPTMLGFFFVGGMVLFERADRTLAGLFTTPMKLSVYFLGKIASLGLLTVLASLFIAVATVGRDFRPLLLVAAIVSTAAVFTLIGLAAVSRFKTINEYLIFSALYMIPFAIPLLEYFNLFRTPLLYLIPTKAALDLISASFRLSPLAPEIWVPASVSLILWLAASWLWAARWFHRYIIMQIGEQGV